MSVAHAASQTVHVPTVLSLFLFVVTAEASRCRLGSGFRLRELAVSLRVHAPHATNAVFLLELRVLLQIGAFSFFRRFHQLLHAVHVAPIPCQRTVGILDVLLALTRDRLTLVRMSLLLTHDLTSQQRLLFPLSLNLQLIVLDSFGCRHVSPSRVFFFFLVQLVVRYLPQIRNNELQHLLLVLQVLVASLQLSQGLLAVPEAPVDAGADSAAPAADTDGLFCEVVLPALVGFVSDVELGSLRGLPEEQVVLKSKWCGCESLSLFEPVLVKININKKVRF